MSLFSRKPKTEEKAAAKPAKAAKAVKAPKAEKAVAAKASAPAVSIGKSVLVRPHITEKTGALSAQNVYTFEVAQDANSREITAAVAAAYKVTPIRVSLLPIRSKAMFVRGKKGRTATSKKAYVHLKEGDKIEFI